VKGDQKTKARGGGVPSGERQKRPPNLLIIMSDDQGPWAMGCAGTPEILTPNLDRLAARGTRFENCFCVSPVCSPARASFLTGRIPSQHGIHDWIAGGNFHDTRGGPGGRGDCPIEYLERLTAFTDVLAARGYVCGLSGKWHLGASHLPQKGHSYWCVHARGGGSYIDYPIFDNRPEPTRQTQYVTDLFADRAIAFLDRHGRGPSPFCLSVHYTAPHPPWRKEEQPPEVWARYEGCGFSSVPSLPPHPWGGWNPSPTERRETLQGYFTAVTAMDAAIGRILAKLDDLGVAEETLVVFTGDNGFNVGHHGILGKGNGTFPLNMYEESVKVPLIVSGPGRVPAGRVSRDLVSHYDFMPTVLDYLGMEVPPNEALPGRSFAGILRGGSGGHEAVVVFSEYGPVRMIRNREWKYIHRHPGGPHELYSLADDPGEARNLVDDSRHAGVLAAMRKDLDGWFARFVAPSLDGAGLPVSGKGQIERVGPCGQGRPAFLPMNS
jgi:arylsulfatase A-like enzyme